MLDKDFLNSSYPAFLIFACCEGDRCVRKKFLWTACSGRLRFNMRDWVRIMLCGRQVHFLRFKLTFRQLLRPAPVDLHLCLRHLQKCHPVSETREGHLVCQILPPSVSNTKPLLPRLAGCRENRQFALSIQTVGFTRRTSKRPELFPSSAALDKECVRPLSEPVRIIAGFYPIRKTAHT
jgi:hypothetical protein